MWMGWDMGEGGLLLMDGECGGHDGWMRVIYLEEVPAGVKRG